MMGRQPDKAKKSGKTKLAKCSKVELLVPDKTKCAANCGQSPDNLLKCSQCCAICYCNPGGLLLYMYKVHKIHKMPCNRKYAASVVSNTKI